MDSHIDPLASSALDFRKPRGRHLLDRLEPARAWMAARKHSGHWQYTRALASPPAPWAVVVDVNGKRFEGVNFAVQDYLGLASHPDVIQAAQEAAAQYGVHSAGSGALLGNSMLSVQLERTVAEFLHCRHALLFPTGWAAGFGLIQGLVRPGDFVVMDALAHACLQTGAAAATGTVLRFAHNSVEDLREKLQQIRTSNGESAILVVVESLYSMDSDSPDLCRMQALAHEFAATLMVDVAHDLGSSGPGGAGQLGAQDMLGKVDIVMGSFSKTFASNGGFVASNHEAVKDYLSWFSSPWTFSNALSPMQCAAVLESFRIVQSDEGEILRRYLLDAVSGLRSALLELGCEVLGEPSAIVPVIIGDPGLARTASRILPELGVFANMAELPAVPFDRARFRLQVMASHTADAVRRGAEAVAQALHEARLVHAARSRAEAAADA